MSKQSDAVKKWRKNAKQKLIAAFGSKCAICQYDTCPEVFEFHHLDPSEKETHWGKINGSIVSWKRIVQEMQKCIMLCSNCHKEVHAQYSIVPANAQRLDESLISPTLLYTTALYDNCPVCNIQKLKARRTCSIECANKRKIKIVDWSQHDVVSLVDTHKSYEDVGELLGVTGAAVARKYKRMIYKLQCIANSSGRVPPS